MASAPARVAVAPMNFCLAPVVRSTFVQVRWSPGVTPLSPPRSSPELEFRQKSCRALTVQWVPSTIRILTRRYSVSHREHACAPARSRSTVRSISRALCDLVALAGDPEKH
jgi:hypothetical protein